MIVWSKYYCLIECVMMFTSEVAYLWPAVTEVINITANVGGPEPTELADSLAAEAIRMWLAFNHTVATSLKKRNDEFYHWQKDVFHSKNESSWPSMMNLPAYQKIYGYMERVTKRYLTRLGVAIPTDFSIDSWVAVHEDGEYHGPHTHTGDLVVGVFYARIGKLSGSLMLYDPRGYNSPFGRSKEMRMQTGQIILFPAWLGHSALASAKTHAKDFRVIIAFNVGSFKGSKDSSSWSSDKTTEAHKYFIEDFDDKSMNQ